VKGISSGLKLQFMNEKIRNLEKKHQEDIEELMDAFNQAIRQKEENEFLIQKYYSDLYEQKKIKDNMNEAIREKARKKKQREKDKEDKEKAEFKEFKELKEKEKLNKTYKNDNKDKDKDKDKDIDKEVEPVYESILKKKFGFKRKGAVEIDFEGKSSPSPNLKRRDAKEIQFDEVTSLDPEINFDFDLNNAKSNDNINDDINNDKNDTTGKDKDETKDKNIRKSCKDFI